jgi:hypothetical protein
MSDLKECLLAFQAIDARGQIILGIVAALTVGGIITLFILVAILPNAPVAISTLLTAIGGVLAGRASK